MSRKEKDNSMKKVIRITESQLNGLIERALLQEFRLNKTTLPEGTRGIAKPVEDKYHPVWDEEDTILSWYCAKYAGDNDLRKLGLGNEKLETEKYEKDALGELANYYIGTTKFSLMQQMRNMKFLAKMPGGLASTSRVQRHVFEKYGHMEEPELREICKSILDARHSDINERYQKFIMKYNENMGAAAANSKVKSEKEKREGFKKDSEAKRDAELKKMGLMFDPLTGKVKKIPPKPYM